MLDFDEGVDTTDVIQAPEWTQYCECILVQKHNMEACIEDILNAPKAYFSLDLEATGLDTRVYKGQTRDKIVGFCLAPCRERAYYVPVAHKIQEANVSFYDWAQAFSRVMDKVSSAKLRAIFHNGEFDQELLEFNQVLSFGPWDDRRTWEDTKLMAYVIDPTAKRRGLKHLSKTLCNIDQIELLDLFPEEKLKKKNERKLDFSLLDPRKKEVLWYACGDAYATYVLFETLEPKIYQKQTDGESLEDTYIIEKYTTPATRWMIRSRIKFDKAKCMDLIKLGQTEWFDSITDIYTESEKTLGRDVRPSFYKILMSEWASKPEDMFLSKRLESAKRKALSSGDEKEATIEINGKYYPLIYDINSPAQLGALFDEFGFEGLPRTETGQVQTDAEVLEDLIERFSLKYPFLRKVKKFREIAKAISSYLEPIYEDVDPEDDTLRIPFRQDGTDTGRYTTKTSDSEESKKKIIQGFARFNLHAFPATYDPNRPECMNRLRELVVPKSKDRFITAIDLSGVELRIATNYSLERLWLPEFFRCSSCGEVYPSEFLEDGLPPAPASRCVCGSDKIGDLHTKSAMVFYGDDFMKREDGKQLRQNSKVANFALLYAGGGRAVQAAICCDELEGRRIKRLFDTQYKDINFWWKETRDFAKKHGFVRTMFGRIYPLPDIHSKEKGFQAKAERNAVNSPIQGTCADMLKIAMGDIYRETKKRGWESKLDMIVTMHDELVFEIEGSILEEAIPLIVNFMTRNKILAKRVPNNMKRVPYTSDIEIGPNWTVPWDYKSIKNREVRFKGDKAIKDPKKAKDQNLDWDSLPLVPQSLSNYVNVIPSVEYKLKEGFSLESLEVINGAIKEHYDPDNGHVLILKDSHNKRLRIPEVRVKPSIKESLSQLG